MGAVRRSRKTVSLAHRKTWDWPEPNISGWELADKKRYHRFKEAITAYLAGDKVARIESRFSLRISQVQEQLARALELDSEGKILGFCGLIRSLHLREHTRTAALPIGPHPTGPMCKGGLLQLLTSEQLYDEFEARVLGKSKSLKVAKLTGMAMQEWLANELIARGYKHTQYPFTTRTSLYTSVVRLMRTIQHNNMSAHINAYGAPKEATNLDVMSGREMRLVRAPPLREVEIDEHKLHGIGIVRITIDGKEKRVPAERAVGIAICDCGSGAILGAAVCLNPEAKAQALIEAIRSAVIPGHVVRLPSGQEAPPFRPGDFDSTLSGTLWSVAYLDNAKIHAGDDYLIAAKRMGSQTCYGPLGSWSGRPNIENVFSRLVRGKFGALPSTTSPDSDSRPGRAPAERAIACDIDFDELCTTFYRSLAKINTTVTAGALNQTTIELLANYLKGPQRPLLRRLPPVSAANPEIGVKSVIVTVRRRSEENPNLYVFHLNKYTNDVLSKRADLEGQEIIIHVDSDLRTVQAFEINGKPLGQLRADGFWGHAAHNEDIKRAVDRDSHLRFAQHPNNLNPIQRMLQEKAAAVLKRDEIRPRGGIVKGALQLQGLMAASHTEQIQIASPPIPAKPISRSLNNAAARAKKMQHVTNQLKKEQADGSDREV